MPVVTVHSLIDSVSQTRKAIPETKFGRGVRHFGMMLTWVTMSLVLFVLLLNIILHRPVLESFLFYVALAVGTTPDYSQRCSKCSPTSFVKELVR